MAYEYIGSASASNSSSHDLNIGIPTGTGTGHYVVGGVTHADNRLIIVPSGWSQLFSHETSGGNDRAGAGAYDVFTSGDADPAFWDIPDSSLKLGTILTFDGFLSQLASAFNNESSSTAGASPAVTINDVPALVLSWHMKSNNAASGPTPPSGYDMVDSYISGGGSIHVASKLVESTGTETPGAWAFSSESAGRVYRWTVAFEADSTFLHGGGTGWGIQR